MNTSNIGFCWSRKTIDRHMEIGTGVENFYERPAVAYVAGLPFP